MAQDLINSIVDRPVVGKQITDTVADLEALQKQLIDNVNAAMQLNNVLGKSVGVKDFKTNTDAASASIDKLQKQLEQQRLAEIKLQQAREKNIDDYNKKLAQQEAAKEKAAAREAANLAKQEAQREKAAQAEAKRVAKEEADKQKATDKEIANSKKRQAQDDKEAVNDAKNLLKTLKNREAFNRLKQDFETAKTNAQNIGAEKGVNSEDFIKASKNANELGKQVDGINTKLNDFKSNVGNYASAAFGFIRQAAYILPGLGIAGIIGLITDGLIKLGGSYLKTNPLLEASNNLNKEANNLYATQSTEVNGLVRELTNQNTSQVRQTEIMETLNKISPTYFGGLKDQSDIITKLPDAYKKYNNALLITTRILAGQSLLQEAYKKQLEAQRDLAESTFYFDPKNFNEVEKQYSFIDKARMAFTHPLGTSGIDKDINRASSQVTYFANEVSKLQMKLQLNGGDIAGNQITMQQRIANNALELEKIRLQTTIDVADKVAANEQKSYRQREDALKTSSAAQIKIAELSQKQELSDVTITNDQKSVIEAKTAADILKINADLTEKRKDLANKARQQDIVNLTKDLETQKKTAKNIVDDQAASLDQRQKALDEYRVKSLQIIALTEKQQIQASGSNDKSIKTAHKEALNARLDVDTDYTNQVDKIYQDEYNRQIKAAQEHDKKLIDTQKTATADRVSEITSARNREISSLNEQFKQGLVNEQQYAARRQAIEQGAISNVLQAQIDGAKLLLDQQAAAGQDTAAQAKTLSDLEIRLAEQTEQAKIDAYRKGAQERSKLVAAEFQLVKDVFAAVADIYNGFAGAQKDRLSEQSDAVDRNADAEKDAVERSLATSKEKSNQEKIIDAKAQAEKEKIAKQQRKIDHDAAEFNKVISAVNIAVTAAESIGKISAIAAVLLANPLTAAFAPIAFAQIPFVIASAAIQEAAVLAQPLPAYKDGIKSAPGGWSIFGEAGTEYVKEPGKKGYLTSGPTVGYLPTGTEVVSNTDLMNAMANPGSSRHIENQLNLSQLLQQNESHTRRLEKALQVKQANNYRVGVRDGKRFSEYLKRNIN